MGVVVSLGPAVAEAPEARAEEERAAPVVALAAGAGPVVSAAVAVAAETAMAKGVEAEIAAIATEAEAALTFGSSTS